MKVTRTDAAVAHLTAELAALDTKRTAIQNAIAALKPIAVATSAPKLAHSPRKRHRHFLSGEKAAQRNAIIMAQYSDGRPPRAIGREFRITAERVRQIVSASRSNVASTAVLTA